MSLMYEVFSFSVSLSYSSSGSGLVYFGMGTRYPQFRPMLCFVCRTNVSPVGLVAPYPVDSTLRTASRS